ncbi:MAG: hypothetical protein JXB29_04230 [Sedimentisphaerales bacterium]|nr:hypothetical protein [Sedimentisphaerales bacterium]
MKNTILNIPRNIGFVVLLTISILGITIAADGGVFDSNSACDTVNIKSFGAVGNGTTDDTAAFQAALDAAMTNGHAILIPGGATIRVTSTLTYLPAESKHGPRIIGQGRGKSKIKFDFRNGQPLFKVWNQTAGQFIDGGGFSDLEIYSPSGSLDSQGSVFSLSGWWSWNIDNCYVNNVHGDVVTVPDRTGESSFEDPNASECSYGLLTRCRFQYIDGYGYASHNSVYASVRILRCLLAECKEGAVLSGGAGLYIISSGFGVNGKKDSAWNPTILIQRQLGETGQRFEIIGNELQGSAGPHIRLQGAQDGIIARNRFNTDPWSPWGSGSYPTLGIDFDPDGVAGAVNMCIDIENNFVRRSTTYPFTFIDFHNSPANNVINVRNTIWSNNAGSTGLTKFANVPSGCDIVITDPWE